MFFKCSVCVACTFLLLVHGCGGGGGGGSPAANNSGASAPVFAVNVQPISIASGASGVNLPVTSVTLCNPGSDVICQTIDNVLIDTASTGLRINADAVSSALSFPQETDPAGNPFVECAPFVSGFAWGPIKIADVKIAGERAASLPIQIVGDPAFPLVPARCSSIGPSFRISGINGVLGIGVFRPDCGIACATGSAAAVYYLCPATGCQPASAPVAQQVQNPIAFFSADNNGAIIQLPAIPAAGASSVNGTLIFGIGTRANNALGGATVLPVNPTTGNLTAVYNNQTYPASIIDSGSNVFFFPDNTIPVCTSASFTQFFCPPSPLVRTATIQGQNGVSASVTFTVGNAETLFRGNRTGIAFNDLAAQQVITNGIDFGLPFFYGRNVYIAIEGASTPAGSGPYFAF